MLNRLGVKTKIFLLTIAGLNAGVSPCRRCCRPGGGLGCLEVEALAGLP